MPMKVEAAIVTQKRPLADFNTDSVNVNGKVFSREVIKNGYKGSGVLSGNVFFALTSSDIEGFADAAVAAFNDRAEKFAVSRDPRSVFSGYFEDCRSALLKMDKNEHDLVSACLYASGRKVVLAKNSDAALYVHRLDGCTPVTPERAEDTVAEYENVVFYDVSAGDMFVLLSPGIAKVLSAKDIEDILRVSDGSVKRVVNLISKVALAREGTDAVSVMAVKVLETAAEETVIGAGFAPDFSHLAPESDTSEKADMLEESAEAAEKSEESANPAEEDVHEPEEETTYTENAETEEKDIAEAFSENAHELYSELEEKGDDSEESAETEFAEDETETQVLSDEEEAEKRRIKSRLKLLIALSALLLLSIVMFVVILVTRGVSDYQEENTTTAETTLEEETTEEETTSEEETSEEETTEEEAGTEEETPSEPSRNETPVNNNVTTPSRQETTSPATTEALSSEETTEEPTEELPTEATSEEVTSEEETPAETSEENTEEETAAETENVTENTSSEENTGVSVG